MLLGVIRIISLARWCLLSSTSYLGPGWGTFIFPFVFLESAHKKAQNKKYQNRVEMRRGSTFWGHTSSLQVPKTLGRLWFWLDNCVLKASFSLPCTSRLPAFSLVVFSPYRNLPFIFSTTEDFQGCDQMPLLPGSPPGCPQSESIALYSAYLQHLMIKSNMLRV